MNVTFSPSCSCAVPVHRCGEPCKLFGRRGCMDHCTKVREDSYFLIVPGRSLRTHRTWGMPKMITCAPRRFIRVARYGPLFNSQGLFSQRCECASPAPSKEWCYRVERPILVRNVVVSPCRFTLLHSTVSTNYTPVYSDQVHATHSCNTRICPSTCELCKRRCDGLHLHGLTPGIHHLCGYVRSLVQNFISFKHRNEQRNALVLRTMLRTNLSN